MFTMCRMTYWVFGHEMTEAALYDCTYAITSTVLQLSGRQAGKD